MTTPTVAEVVAALRSYADDPYSGGSYTDELRARQAADLLEREHRARTEAEAYIASLPADWRKDSSLRTWFPLSADALERAERELAESERKLNIANGTIANLMDAGCPYCLTSAEGTSYCTLAERTVEAETRKREEAESERDANLRRWSDSESKLAECEASLTKAADELAALRKRVAEAPMVTFRLGYAEGLFEVDSAQEDHLVPTGQRVAILPLREGE